MECVNKSEKNLKTIIFPFNLSLLATNVILKLPTDKVSVSNNIPISILKQSAHIYYSELSTIMNDCLRNKMFPGILKNAKITPSHKKDDKGNKKNYRPVSILSNFLKLFERLILSYLAVIWNRRFPDFATGFRKRNLICFSENDNKLENPIKQ